MKLIVAGSRHIDIKSSFLIEILEFFKISNIEEIVSGGAEGIDQAGEFLAETSLSCSLRKFLPDWNTYGKAAGPIRNKKMAAYADALLLIWDGKSRGSKNMKEEAIKRGLKIYEIILREGEG